MANVDFVQLLSYGAIGLGVILAFLAFRLLSQEQKKKTPSDAMLNTIRFFIVSSIVLAIVSGITDVSKAYLGVRSPPPTTDDGMRKTVRGSTNSPVPPQQYVMLTSDDEGGTEPHLKLVDFTREGNSVSGLGKTIDGSKSWLYSGFFNSGYLVLSYRSTDPQGIGFGQYFLEQVSGAGDLFVGYMEGNYCARPGIEPARRIARCNVVAVRGRPGGVEERKVREAYRDFLGQNGCTLVRPASSVPKEKCPSS